MRTYIAPIGYDSARVTRPILGQDIDSETQIKLLVPETDADDNRGKQAIEDVKRMVEQIEPDVSVEALGIPPKDFEQAIGQCASLIDDADGEVVVIFGGGPRDIFLPLTVASLSRTDAIDESYQFSDIDGDVRRRRLPNLTASIPPQTETTLKTISESETPASFTDITNRVEVSKSTVTRHVSQLEQSGIVSTETQGKTKLVELTPTGRLLVARFD